MEFMSWQVLYLKPRMEKKMANICESMGADHYLPLRLRRKIYQRRAVKSEIPLFPSYIFANLDGDTLSRIKTFDMILRSFKPDNEAQLLHQLQQIRLALDVDPTLGAETALKTGMRVKITDGPFAGIEGRVEKVSSITKVSLNVELISQAVRVEVDGDKLEIIG